MWYSLSPPLVKAALYTCDCVTAGCGPHEYNPLSTLPTFEVFQLVGRSVNITANVTEIHGNYTFYWRIERGSSGLHAVDIPCLYAIRIFKTISSTVKLNLLNPTFSGIKVSSSTVLNGSRINGGDVYIHIGGNYNCTITQYFRLEACDKDCLLFRSTICYLDKDTLLQGHYFSLCKSDRLTNSIPHQYIYRNKWDSPWFRSTTKMALCDTQSFKHCRALYTDIRIDQLSWSVYYNHTNP